MLIDIKLFALFCKFIVVIITLWVYTHFNILDGFIYLKYQISVLCI